VTGPLLCGEKRELVWDRRSRDDWTRDDWARADPARDDPAMDEGERDWERC